MTARFIGRGVDHPPLVSPLDTAGDMVRRTGASWWRDWIAAGQLAATAASALAVMREERGGGDERGEERR